ncbi:MAG: hypothetical protein C5B51_15525 [Terriglobia bacterium]|nr:MAG: hypothetical protein C5B51_15525 [Terriglobia bacterium]
MACPYFYPVEREQRGTSNIYPLPLGDAWNGVCRASAGCNPEPDSAQWCSLGYARGRCRHFPGEDSGPDAVRFAISRDDGVRIELYYVLERDHLPFAHGPLEYSLAAAQFTRAPIAETLLRQAEAYVLSYLRRTKEAADPRRASQ